ncbi:hypothetical protein L1887_13376 [Cichorium endivia]|nr:hypothetical protein L1887_13376 [Cichorium endivia]
MRKKGQFHHNHVKNFKSRHLGLLVLLSTVKDLTKDDTVKSFKLKKVVLMVIIACFFMINLFKAHESVVISLGPISSGGYGDAGACGSGGGAVVVIGRAATGDGGGGTEAAGLNTILKPSNWKQKFVTKEV